MSGLRLMLLISVVLVISGTKSLQAETSVMIVNNSELGPEQQKSFDTFTTYIRDFYGVFFIATNKDEATGLSDFHSLENGMKFTRRMCEVDSNELKNTCELYALILPDPTMEIKPRLRGLSETALKVYKSDYLDGETSSTFASFAISPLYNFAYSLDQETQEIADANALVECAEGVSEYLYNLYPKILELVGKEKLVECRIIDQSVNNQP